LKRKKLVIFGKGVNAQLAYEYFTHDSGYDIVAFCVDKDYLNEKEMLSLPVEDFEDIEKKYSPAEHAFFVAVGETALNRFRASICKRAKEKGYKLASYISSKASVWHNVRIGENCFILGDCILQPFAKIGNNVIAWHGTNVGHHSRIGDNCFLATADISGLCEIGKNCFIGARALIADGIKIAKDNYIAMGAVVSKDTTENSIYRGNPAKKASISAKFFCGLEE
jgi:sugar O-acyltransferase (sialic acid O-acetyltransferase NeuD family)